MLTFVVVTKLSMKRLKKKMCFLLFFCVVENSHFCCCRNSNAYIAKIADFFVFIWYLNSKNLLGNAHN